MAKIGIIEDNVEDAIFRYEKLAIPKHEIHLIFEIPPSHQDPALEVFMYRHGFDLHRLYYGLDILQKRPELMGLDIYFCDGLDGRCFGVADMLGAERLCIHTSHIQLEERARQKGIKTLSEEELNRYISELNAS